MDYFDEKIKEATIKMEEAKEKGNYELAKKYADLINEIEAEKMYVIMNIMNNGNGFLKK